MQRREKIELSTIVVLSLVIIAIIPNVVWSNGISELNPNPKQVTKPSFAEQPKVESQSNEATIQPSQLKTEFSEIYKKVENSVVQITSKVSTVNTHIIINGSPLESQSTRLGSGFIYNDKGLIITNAHVVDGTEQVDVMLVDGNSYAAKVIGKDALSDIAVLQITDDLQDEKLIPLEFADSSSIIVGEIAIAIGNPFGLSNTMTTGIISQVGRLIPNPELGFSISNVIQTDAAINPGNSGGPLLNIEGKVIGMNTAIKSNTGEFSGIGFAVPSNTIKRIVPVLIKDGSYKYPWIGIMGTTLTSEFREQLGIAKNFKGVLITSVVKDGPADKAGLKDALYDANKNIKQADILVGIDNQQIKSIDDVIQYITENKSIGQKITLDVFRDGHNISLEAVLSERPTQDKIN